MNIYYNLNDPADRKMEKISDTKSVVPLHVDTRFGLRFITIERACDRFYELLFRN